MLLLARTWLHCTPAELLERLTPAEIAELQAEYEISPWGEDRADLRGALVSAAVRTAAGESNVKLSDWMPKYDREEQRQSEAQMRATLAAAADKIERK